MNFATKLYNWSENVTFVCVEFCNKIAFNLKEKRKKVLDIYLGLINSGYTFEIGIDIQ